VPDAVLHLNSGEAVVALLNGLAHLALDLPSRRGVEFVGECFRWAASATRGSLARKPVLSGSASQAATTDWTGLTTFFREQRRLEQQHVSSGRNGLLETVQLLARAFQNTLLNSRSLDAVALRHVTRLASALAQGTEAALIATATDALPQLRAIAERRQTQSTPQLAEVKQKVAELERAALLTSLSLPFERDKETGFHNLRSLTTHCEFLAAIAALFENPPALILFHCQTASSIELSETRLAHITSQLLQQVFPSPQQFLARPEERLYAVVLAGPSAADAKARTEVALATFARQPSSAPCRAGIARLISGETRGSWFERCNQALTRATPFQLCVAEAPAEFIA
jgi:hypothetical protein